MLLSEAPLGSACLGVLLAPPAARLSQPGTCPRHTREQTWLILKPLGPQLPPNNAIINPFPLNFQQSHTKPSNGTGFPRISLRFSSVMTWEPRRLECGAGCILSGRNYNKVVKDLQLFSHSFSQINTWIHFLFSSLRAYCFVSVATSHSNIPELSRAPLMVMGYQQEWRSSL